VTVNVEFTSHVEQLLFSFTVNSSNPFKILKKVFCTECLASVTHKHSTQKPVWTSDISDIFHKHQ